MGVVALRHRAQNHGIRAVSSQRGRDADTLFASLTDALADPSPSRWTKRRR
jgi:hypothetical protein